MAPLFTMFTSCIFLAIFLVISSLLFFASVNAAESSLSFDVESSSAAARGGPSNLLKLRRRTKAVAGNDDADEQDSEVNDHRDNKVIGLVGTRIQTGRVCRGTKIINDHHDNNGDEDLDVISATTKIPASHTIWVPFTTPVFTHTPVVFAGLTELRASHGYMRVRVSVSDVNASGFFLTMGSWIEPGLPHICASWIASDLPANEIQVVNDEQYLRTIEWGLHESTFSPPLLPPGPEGETLEEALLQRQQNNNNNNNKAAIAVKPSLASSITKIDQKVDAYWMKFEVKAMSVTPLGFTSVIRPWGDAPTFWSGVSHIASALPRSHFQSGSWGTSHEKLGAPTIRFSERMACKTPSVVIFVTCIDQGPPRRVVRAYAQTVTADSFDLFFDLRAASEVWRTKFDWVAVC